MLTNQWLAANGNPVESKEYIEIAPFFTNLKQYCLFLAKNEWDGADLFQETILKAICHYESSEISAALLKKIAYHQWIDTIRKRKHEVPGLREDTLSSSFILQSRAAETVDLLLEKMTPKQAVIFILKEAFRYQSGEIAGLLGMTETAVKASLHRARKRLERETSLREADCNLNEEESELLTGLLCDSLQAEDPAVLIENIQDIPSLFDAPQPEMAMHSRSPLYYFKMAA